MMKRTGIFFLTFLIVSHFLSVLKTRMLVAFAEKERAAIKAIVKAFIKTPVKLCGGGIVTQNKIRRRLMKRLQVVMKALL